jgi:3-deoxy-7-phosphoheptulonate synthase
MRPDASRAAVEAIRNRAKEAGLDAEVFEGAGHSVVGVEDETWPELAELLENMPGVQEVVGREPRAPTTHDLRVAGIRPLVSPAILLEELPLSKIGSATVSRAREEVVHILGGRDERLIVVVGPCSVHDPAAVLDYARHLKRLAEELAQDLCIVMRVYFEKPRTTVGWKGLINDPHLNGSFAVNEGLRLARQLLVNLAESEMPAGCEFLDPILPQFFADTVAWGAIGARTTESQVHRQLASGLSMPVGFKNGTNGGLRIATDAVSAAAYPHSSLGVTKQGLAAIVNTCGNPDCHVVLRGGEGGPNYDAANVRKVLDSLQDAGLPSRVVIDASHGNSGKNHRRQPFVARQIASQVARGELGIVGVMLESFLVDGRQDVVEESHLVYGQSITDSCMGWGTTVPVLRELAGAVRARRSVHAKQGKEGIAT